MKREIAYIGMFFLSVHIVHAQSAVDTVTGNLNALTSQIYIICGAILLLIAIGLGIRMLMKGKKNKGGGGIISSNKPEVGIVPTTTQEYSLPTMPEPTNTSTNQ